MSQQNPKLRRLAPCHRHPHLPTTTGLCGPCLHERLSLLKPTAPSSAAPPPELRRCKTFSGNNAAAAAASVVDSSRRSCDVRGSESLSSLFVLENSDVGGVIEVESSNLGLTCPVLENDNENDNDDDDEDEESVPEGKVEIARVSNYRNDEGDDECDVDLEEGKTMKEFIDLELRSSDKSNRSNYNRKDFKEIAGSFLGVASVFSKKFRKWRKKEERTGECRNNDGNCGRDRVDLSLGELKIEDLRGRRLSYTQSEVGDCGLGRRSCDTDPRGSLLLGRASIDCGAFGRKSCDSDPRFSIDFGRTSVDCGRMSVEESKSEFVDLPRASWDGYLVGGGRTTTLNHTGGGPVVSVIENAMATVYGFDDRVLGEGKVKMENGDDKDSSLRRRKGFDRCSSVRREAVAMSGEEGEVGLSNAAKVSPAAIGIFKGTKLLITEKELNEWRLKSMKDDSSESFETASKELGSVSSSSVGKDEKKCRQWSKLWNIWGLLHRRKADNKFSNEDDQVTRAEESKPNDIARNSNRGGLTRSYSTSSSRGSSSVIGSGRVDSKAIVKRRQDDGLLDRNRSCRYSPNQIDNNGLLRFYLTPLRSNRRNRLGKSRLKKSHSLARSVLKM
ncbi:hypothetical protein vseg_010115 [Gypsophila vaccaria]